MWWPCQILDPVSHCNNMPDPDPVIFIVADPDPGSAAFWNLDPGSGMGKKSGFGSGMNNLNHISESLETNFWAKILKFFDAGPGSGMEKILIRDPSMEKIRIRIRDKHPGSATMVIMHQVLTVPVWDLLRRDVEEGGSGLAAPHLRVDVPLAAIVLPRQMVRGYVHPVQLSHLPTKKLLL